MQSAGWYFKHLRSMSAAEIGWRVASKVRATCGEWGLAARATPPAIGQIVGGNGTLDAWAADRPALLPLPPVGETSLAEIAREELRAEADRLCEHRFSFFGFDNKPLGATIDWNREYDAGVSIPLIYAPKLDYRDYRACGDCKYAWEPSRHCHLVTLGRAYRALGDERYAKEVADQIRSWIEQCPVDRGMQWRSPMELAIRMLNWSLALELIRPSAAVTDELVEAMLGSVYRHVSRVDRSYSRYSSANHHLVGEAAGVFVAATCFHCLADAARWRARSQALLIEAMAEQCFPDGVHREQATGYHFFVLDFFVLAGLFGRRSGGDFPDAYWQGLERMFEFVAGLAATGAAPLFGDCDDGAVTSLGGRRNDPIAYLPLGAVLFERESFKAIAPAFSQRAYWLLGDEGQRAFDALPDAAADAGLADDIPLAFPDAGYYILRDRATTEPPPLAVMFDCGTLGFRSVAAHGHADALSFIVVARGQPILVDPGTYDYFTYRSWRDYFRSTRAHNTIVVDGRDQSEATGPFHWGRRAEARCEKWESGPDGITVAGSHDGYRQLDDPVTHRREIRLDPAANRIDVTDRLDAAGTHAVEVWFHFAAACDVQPVEDHRFAITTPTVALTLTIDAALETACHFGSEDPICGWVSDAYHRRERAVSLVARARIQQTATFRCSLELAADD